MINCPECNEKINKLEANAKTTLIWDFSLDQNNEAEYDNMIINDDTDDTFYICPFCNKTLFRDEDKAVNFLKGIKNENN